MALLSVIVPVYDVGDFLREGLNSVLSQSMGDLEVICVDDVSTDDSLSILEEYAKLDSRVSVHRNEYHNGVSYTRNEGLRFAQGDYVHFFDSDDVLCKDMYERMLSKGGDLVMCGYETFPNGKCFVLEGLSGSTLSLGDFLQQMNKGDGINRNLSYAWRFLYKRDLLVENKILFNENVSYGEDSLFNLEVWMNARDIRIVSESCYRYRTHEKSIMRQVHKPGLESCLQIQIAEKKRIAREYDVDKYVSFTQDMYEDIVRRYTMMMFRNLQEKDKSEGVKRILNMPMVREAFNKVGYKNVYSSWKEFLFYLAMKNRWYGFVRKYV